MAQIYFVCFFRWMTPFAAAGDGEQRPTKLRSALKYRTGTGTKSVLLDGNQNCFGEDIAKDTVVFDWLLSLAIFMIQPELRNGWL